MRKMIVLILGLILLLMGSALADAGLSATHVTVSDTQAIITTGTDVCSVKLMTANDERVGSITHVEVKSGKIEWTMSIGNARNTTLYVYVQDGSNRWHQSNLEFRVNASVQAQATPRPTAVPAPSWNHVSMTAYSARVLEYSSTRIQSRVGPGKEYPGGGAYKQNQITSLKAFFTENVSGKSWVYAELTYTKGYRRRVYFATSSIGYGNVPHLSFTKTPAVTLSYVTPHFGPSGVYDQYKAAAIASGTRISVLCEENGWLFIEYNCSEGLVRAWIPENVAKPL